MDELEDGEIEAPIVSCGRVRDDGSDPSSDPEAKRQKTDRGAAAAEPATKLERKQAKKAQKLIQKTTGAQAQGQARFFDVYGGSDVSTGSAYLHPHSASRPAATAEVSCRMGIYPRTAALLLHVLHPDHPTLHRVLSAPNHTPQSMPDAVLQARASIEVKTKQPIRLGDVQSLVLWVLGECVAPRWVFVKVNIEKLIAASMQHIHHAHLAQDRVLLGVLFCLDSSVLCIQGCRIILARMSINLREGLERFAAVSLHLI